MNASASIAEAFKAALDEVERNYSTKVCLVDGEHTLQGKLRLPRPRFACTARRVVVLLVAVCSPFTSILDSYCCLYSTWHCCIYIGQHLLYQWY